MHCHYDDFGFEGDYGYGRAPEYARGGRPATLNARLSDIFTLALLYLNPDYERSGGDAVVSQRVHAFGSLQRLAECGLIHRLPDDVSVSFTEEGVREARGLLKFLQIALGPHIGASLDDIRDAEPELLAHEIVDGAGPLTMDEVAYALSGRPAAGHPAPLGPTMLADPPASYHRAEGDGRAFLLMVRLPLRAGGPYGRSVACWRKILAPAGLTFLDLHIVIQRCFCWLDTHPFGFELRRGGKNHLIGEPEVLGEVPRVESRRHAFLHEDASETLLGDLLVRGWQTVTYCYGTGCPWRHDIEVLDVVDGLAAAGPQLLDGIGDAPGDWMLSAEELVEFTEGLLLDEASQLKALADAGERGFEPFALSSARRKLMGFEEHRAHWQERLDARGSEGEPLPHHVAQTPEAAPPSG